jgi:hypothetical protein
MDQKQKINLIKAIRSGELSAAILNVEPGSCFLRNDSGKYQFREGKSLSVSELETMRERVDLLMISVFIHSEATPYAIIFRELHDKDHRGESLEARGFKVRRFESDTCLTKELADWVTEIFKDIRPLDELTTDELYRRVDIFRRAHGKHMCPKCRYIDQLDHDVDPHICPKCKFEHSFDSNYEQATKI